MAYSSASDADLKERVKQYWDDQPCGTDASSSRDLTLAQFEEIESFRYRADPNIHAFAQFTRYRGKRVLEVGIGAGTDFLQWVRAGADAWGVDLTPAGVEVVRQRLRAYGLDAHVSVADAENLPFPSDTFDLVYSYGVIHHTPDTYAALREIVRVTKPGGEIKLMVYNRHSVHALLVWVLQALHVVRRGRLFHGLKWAISRSESPGTKAYTRKEIARWMQSLPLRDVVVRPERTYFDYQPGHPRIYQTVAVLPVRLAGDRFAYFMRISATKMPTISPRAAAAETP